MHLSLTAVVVEDYDPAIEFFMGKLGFGLAEDSPAVTNDARMEAAGVQFVSRPRVEPYGQVVVFTDIAGNKWDLIGRPA